MTMPSDPGRMTPDDDLPELTDSERAAMDALPPDFVTRLLGGEKLEFGPEGKPVRWVRQTTPDAEAVRLAERLDRANFLLRNCERTLQLCWRDMREWIQFGRYNAEGIIAGEPGPLPEPPQRPQVAGVNYTEQNVTVVEEAIAYIRKHLEGDGQPAAATIRRLAGTGGAT